MGLLKDTYADLYGERFDTNPAYTDYDCMAEGALHISLRARTCLRLRRPLPSCWTMPRTMCPAWCSGFSGWTSNERPRAGPLGP